MKQWTGWLLDLYAHPEHGIMLWLLSDDGQRLCLRQDFPATFYAAGPSPRLRALWQFLQAQQVRVDLSRTERHDLFNGATVVLAARLQQAAALPRLYQKAVEAFPELTFYDADLHITLRHAALYGTFPLARCAIAADEEGWIQELQVLDSRWELDPEPPPLRIMTIETDVDPMHAEPKEILIRTPKVNISMDARGDPSALGSLDHLLKQYDPDLILSSRGDTWLLPLLLKMSQEQNLPLPLNRDPGGKISYRRERSYFAYNQIIYRGRQVHLAGRIHVDIHNTVMYHDYGLAGVFEMSRVSSLPIQTAARVSPGTGISSMQIVTALGSETLVPLRKEQVELPKTTTQLFREDMGGAVYDPIIGLHADVAEVDFASMYPSIMVQFNISPETVNTVKPTSSLVPELGMIVDRDRPGLIPRTLAPLLEKRLKLKKLLLSLSQWDCRYKGYKAQAAAHKWLTVTCFGYLGYKNARFGRIEAHEAVTAYGREVMMRAKEAAEDMGFRVLHLYVDGMWIKKPGCSAKEDFTPLLDEIHARTQLTIALDGVYKWIAFLPSRMDRRIAVPNRYFGLFQSGEIKTRGIETRRHDTPPFISETQMQVLEILAKAPDASRLKDKLPEVRALVQRKQADLRQGRIPLDRLVVHQTVSRNLNEYRAPTASAAALGQLEGAGKSLRPGQSIGFVYTLGKPGARAWDLPGQADVRAVDVKRYRRLLMRAVNHVLEPAMEMEDPLAAIEAAQLSFFEKICV
jgi:DNA polymerase-2